MWGKVLGAFAAFAALAGVVGGTVAATQYFASQDQVAAIKQSVDEEFDARSLGTLINLLRIALATNDLAAIRQICWEITQLTGKVHPDCVGR